MGLFPSIYGISLNDEIYHFRIKSYFISKWDLYRVLGMIRLDKSLYTVETYLNPLILSI
jgi:hypothetical protein